MSKAIPAAVLMGYITKTCSCSRRKRFQSSGLHSHGSDVRGSFKFACTLQGLFRTLEASVVYGAARGMLSLEAQQETQMVLIFHLSIRLRASVSERRVSYVTKLGYSSLSWGLDSLDSRDPEVVAWEPGAAAEAPSCKASPTRPPAVRSFRRRRLCGLRFRGPVLISRFLAAPGFPLVGTPS